MPAQIISSHAPQINQPMTEGTFIFPLIQTPRKSEADAATLEPPPGSLSHLSSPLQHQTNCLQAIDKTIQQFNQHLDAERLNRQTLQLIVLQLRTEFALLRYLLFSNKDIVVTNSAASLLFNPNLTLILSLTPLHLPSHFPALVIPNFVVLPLWALWDHP